ncbi:MAG: hypothetical protein AAF529_16595, partial [Pseudomonadota bacterium]
LGEWWMFEFADRRLWIAKVLPENADADIDYQFRREGLISAIKLRDISDITDLCMERNDWDYYRLGGVM